MILLSSSTGNQITAKKSRVVVAFLLVAVSFEAFFDLFSADGTCVYRRCVVPLGADSARQLRLTSTAPATSLPSLAPSSSFLRVALSVWTVFII